MWVIDYEVSHAYVKLGDKDEAFKWLEKGKRERAECMVWLLCEPWMDPLRKSAGGLPAREPMPLDGFLKIG